MRNRAVPLRPASTDSTTFAEWAFVALAAALALGSSPPAHALTYPDKPLRLIVGLPAGGGADAIARAVGAKLGNALGQPVVVDNRPGAGGRIAAEAVAKASPDGYTLLFAGSAATAIAVLLYKKLPYDPLKDFTPISLAATVPIVLVVSPSMPSKSVGEFIAYAKANPGRISYASAGTGGVLHLSMEMLKLMTGIDVVHVPYKGGVQAIPDLLAGQIQAMFEILPTQLPHITAGKTRALAVTTARRSAHLPHVQTMIEAGVAGFDVILWYGVFAPAGVQKPIGAKLNARLSDVGNAPDVKERLATLGADAAPSSAGQLVALQKSEIARWGKVVKAAGITAE